MALNFPRLPDYKLPDAFPIPRLNFLPTHFPMKLTLAWIGKTKDPAIASLTAEYLKRIARYVPTDSAELRSETALLEAVKRQHSVLVLLDSGGKELSSEQFAEFL